MSAIRLEVDYLIVGAGAMGMAFADEILTTLPEATVALVDRRAKPGGHWNDAYPYVRLHQPAISYGVNSAPLGTGGSDLSSGSEILAYYERALERFLTTGRARFLSRHDHRGDGRVVSLLDERHDYEITATERIVDATFMGVEVPATHGPGYEVDPEIPVVPPNDLVRLERPPERYVVVGGGKTGGDAVVFLRERGVEPDRIQWIISRDMWMWNRAVVQPDRIGDEFLGQMEAIREADDVDEVFLRLERQGSVFRLDPEVMPEKWRCATFNQREAEALRSVSDVVRAGRVERVGPSTIELEAGSVPYREGSLIVDCTADGLARHQPRPLFEPGRVTLQSVMLCQQVFSAAVVGHLETMDLDDSERNAMWQVVPHPELTADMPEVVLATFRNVLNASHQMPRWLARSRVNLFKHAPPSSLIPFFVKVRLAYPEARAAARELAATA